MTFMDRLKRRADELDLQGKADQLADAAAKAAHRAKDRAAELADENRDKVGGVLDKAGAAIDERTQGKYADKVAKAKQQVAKGVDRLAEQRPDHGRPGMPQDAPTRAPQDFPSSPQPSPQPTPPVVPPSPQPTPPVSSPVSPPPPPPYPYDTP